MPLVQLLFGFKRLVSRRQYVVAGLVLMVLKYGVEAAVLRALTGRWLTPAAFLSPLYETRLRLLDAAPDWVSPAFYIWTLPFLWVAASMSVRRAADAGQPAWVGLCILVPWLNYLMMALLAIAPTAAVPVLASPNDRFAAAPRLVEHRTLALVASILFGPVWTLLMVNLSVHLLNEYGAVLFLLSPVLIGAASAFLAGVARPGEPFVPFAAAGLSLLAAGVTLLVFAMEGLICLVMAAPLAFGAGLVGAIVGYLAAQFRPSRRTRYESWIGCLALPLLPLLAVGESRLAPPPDRRVTTVVIVDAPPAVVWQHVVHFSELTERPEWYFRAGLAAPLGATITGTGPGAVRRCRFTTGDFIEPITVWDEPRLLAFDVAAQPHPMSELNPFGRPHPPHLDTALLSRRGEFRLTPLPDGRTRLSGTTWYRLDMAPQAYWGLWSDTIIARIHARVLRHVAHLAEADAV